MTDDLRERFDALDTQLPELTPPLAALHRRGRRSMARRRAALSGVLALAAVASAAGYRAAQPQTRTVVVASDIAPDVQRRLLELADDLAERNKGRAERVEVVASTRLEAVGLTSGAVLQAKDDALVYVLQVEGDFTCGGCSVPAGFQGQITGRFLTSVLDRNTLQGSDGGIGNRKADLSLLGPVTRLR